MDFVDTQGSAKLHEIATLAAQEDITLRLARVKPGVRQLLQRDGVVDLIGEENITANVEQAVRDRPAGG
jgi:MFS superfamily sulfate permease-like transporter